MAALLAACRPAPIESWPNVTLLITPGAADYADDDRLSVFIHRDGTGIAREVVDPAQLPARLAGIKGPALVLLEDAEAWQRLLDAGQLAPRDWLDAIPIMSPAFKDGALPPAGHLFLAVAATSGDDILARRVFAWLRQRIYLDHGPFRPSKPWRPQGS